MSKSINSGSGGMQANITWPRAILWSLGTGLLVSGMFGGVLLGWKWLHPADPFLASLDAGEVVGFLGIILLATFGTMFYWFTFMLADRRAERRGRDEPPPRV